MKTALTIENSHLTSTIDAIECEADFWAWIEARFRLAATGSRRSECYVSGNDEITVAMVKAGMLRSTVARMSDQRDEAAAAMAKVAALFHRIGSEYGLQPHASGQFSYVGKSATKSR